MLGKELDRALGTHAPAAGEAAPDYAAAAGNVQGGEPAGELAHERPRSRDFNVPEAEVVIVRRERAAPAQQGQRVAAEAPRAASPRSAEPLRKPRPANGVEGAPRAVFDGVVEEASVVIIRRPSRERIP